MSDLRKASFVCIDCETTGLDPKKDQIVELALLQFTLEENLESMESLIQPECPIPESSIAIHHITEEMVAGKPKIGACLPEFLRLIGNRIIVGHGVGFDIEVLSQAAAKAQIPCTIQNNLRVDTLRLARLYGESPVNSLESLRKHFNIPEEGAHRAMNDVIVNTAVFRQLSKRYPTTEKLFATLDKPVLMMHVPLGKHKGRSFQEVPLPYLHWMSRQEFDMDLLFSIRMELKRRKKGGIFQQAGNPFLNL